MLFTDACRLCLSSDRRKYSISNTPLQVVWEKLTNTTFDVGDGRPLDACYICCAHLRQSVELLQRALRADELFTKFINSGLEKSNELLKLLPIARQTYNIDYNYHIKQQSNMECKQNDTIIDVTEQTGINNRELEGKLFVYKDENEFDFKGENEHHMFATDENVTVEVEVDITRDSVNIKDEEYEELLHASDSSRVSDEGSDEDGEYASIIKEEEESQSYVTDETITFIEIDLEENENVFKERENGKYVYDRETVRISEEGLEEAVEYQINMKEDSEGETFSGSEGELEEAGNYEIKTKEDSRGTPKQRSYKSNKARQNVKQTKLEKTTRDNKSLVNSVFRSLSNSNTVIKSDIPNTSLDTNDGRHFSSIRNKRRLKNDGRGGCKGLKKGDLNKHLRRHNGNTPYMCDFCNYTAHRISNLKRHVQYKHTREMNFLCHICPYKCVAKFVLEKHLLKHSGERPYACFVCDYSSLDKATLRKHVLCKHTNDKKFSCPMCDFKAFTKTNLNIHLRKHTGEKLFVCYICDYKSLGEKDLKRHMQYKHTKEKNLSCPICSYKCVEKGNMARHIRTHTGEKPYGCGMCEYRSKDSSTLNKHMRVRHGL